MTPLIKVFLQSSSSRHIGYSSLLLDDLSECRTIQGLVTLSPKPPSSPAPALVARDPKHVHGHYWPLGERGRGHIVARGSCQERISVPWDQRRIRDPTGIATTPHQRAMTDLSSTKKKNQQKKKKESPLVKLSSILGSSEHTRRTG